MPSWWQHIKNRFFPHTPLADHLQRGSDGERAAQKYLISQGMHFLAANFRVPEGEIDLVFRDKEVLVFVEVKTRSSEQWERPAAAVDCRKRRRISRAALAYLHEIGRPRVKFRFDVVEVLLPRQGEPLIRHWPNAFSLSGPYRYAAAADPADAPRRQW